MQSLKCSEYLNEMSLIYAKKEMVYEKEEMVYEKKEMAHVKKAYRKWTR